jgi:sugar lactone lactonase YvrE
MRCARPFLVVLALGCGHGTSPAPGPAPIQDLPQWTTLDVLAGHPGGEGIIDGDADHAHFAAPTAMAFDGAGHMYLADLDTIRTIDVAARTVKTLAGSSKGFADGVGPDAHFDSPSGLAVTADAVYVTDTENNSLRKIDPATGTVTLYAGAGQGDGDADGVGTAARFREPEGLALDGAGGMYVADTDNNTVRKVDLATQQVTTVAGTATEAGKDDGVGAAARFLKPSGLAWSTTGDLYVADFGNSAVRKVHVADYTVSTLATLDGRLQGIAVVGGAVFVTLQDGRVMRIDAASGAQSVLAGAANTTGFVDAVGAAARFSYPAGLVADASGALYLADVGNFALRRIDTSTGAVKTFLGANSAGDADGTGTAARFREPAGILADPSGALYVADTKNHVLRRVDRPSGAVTTIAGASGQPGQADGAAADARFNFPSGLAKDGDTLYVADAANKAIRRFDVGKGQVSTLALPATTFGYPAGIAFADGRLYVTDSQNHTLVAIDPASLAAEIFAGAAAQADSRDGTGGDARFHSPVDIVADGKGALYVADSASQAIRKIDIATRAVSTVAGKLRLQGSADGTGSEAQFAYPSNLAFHASGYLFVSDLGNDTVRRVKLDDGVVTTVIGVAGRQGVVTGPLPAQLGRPLALTVTPDGELAVVSENTVLRAH